MVHWFTCLYLSKWAFPRQNELLCGPDFMPLQRFGSASLLLITLNLLLQVFSGSFENTGILQWPALPDMSTLHNHHAPSFTITPWPRDLCWRIDGVQLLSRSFSYICLIFNGCVMGLCEIAAARSLRCEEFLNKPSCLTSLEKDTVCSGNKVLHSGPALKYLCVWKPLYLQKKSKDHFGQEGDEESTMLEDSVSPKKWASFHSSLRTSVFESSMVLVQVLTYVTHHFLL